MTSLAEKIKRRLGLIHGNWYGPGWSGGVYTSDPDPFDVCHVEAVDEIDSIARVHDLAYFLFNCKYVPREIRLHQMRRVTAASAQYLSDRGHHATAFLARASHVTWYDIVRAQFYREYNEEETRHIIHWYRVALDTARVTYSPAHSRGVEWPAFDEAETLAATFDSAPPS